MAIVGPPVCSAMLAKRPTERQHSSMHKNNRGPESLPAPGNLARVAQSLAAVLPAFDGLYDIQPRSISSVVG